MSLSIAIVGLPNVGKSTLFNALVGSRQAEAANFPFCTIEPNTAIVNVPDKRLDRLSDIVHPEKVIPAAVEFVDIAGLVKGASEGEGLGNKFLSHIRECDAICQVVRAFEDENITHVHNKIHPKNDIEVINTELILADLETVEKRIAKTQGGARTGDKEMIAEMEVLERVRIALEQGDLVHSIDIPKEKQPILKSLHLITGKPFLYLVNIGEKMDVNKDYHHDIGLERTEVVIPVNIEIEQELSELAKEDKQMFMSEYGMKKSSLDRLIQESYILLGLQTYFTAGVQEVRAWTIHKGDTAPQAAGVIHTDFEKGFIKAETVSYEDFITNNGWNGSREKGKVRQEGKEYIVKDGDVMLFKFSS